MTIEELNQISRNAETAIAAAIKTVTGATVDVAAWTGNDWTITGEDADVVRAVAITDLGEVVAYMRTE